MNKTTLITISIVVVVILGIAFAFSKSSQKPGEYDQFAQCLGEKGATFYGTFWCPHCQNQKKLFGKSAKLLPYVECSTPDGKGQLEICQEAEIEGYPTWEFADKTRLSGEISLEELSEKTGCVLPE